MVSELNHLAVTYGPAILATGFLSPFITAAIRLVSSWKWTHNDLVRASFAFLVYAVVSLFHALTAAHSVDGRIVALQGAVMFVVAQPFFYVLVRPLFAQIDAVVAKSVAYDALATAKPATSVAAAKTDFTQ